MKGCVYAKVCPIAITHNVIPTCLHSIPSVKCSITAVYSCTECCNRWGVRRVYVQALLLFDV